MPLHPYKRPFNFLQPLLEKLQHQNNLQLANTFPSISKWIEDELIDNKTSNNFWTNPTIIYAQIRQILKFKYSYYIGNAKKHLFWPIDYTYTNCTICHTPQAHTWLQVDSSFHLQVMNQSAQ